MLDSKMTEEEKKLLYIDLCGRLPYIPGQKILWKGEEYEMIGIGFGRVTLVKPLMSCTAGSPLIEEVKPILRPINSLTEKELRECGLFAVCTDGSIEAEKETFDWFDEHDIDYRGLIDLGLAEEKKI
jgi:hypothetical protein